MNLFFKYLSITLDFYHSIEKFLLTNFKSIIIDQLGALFMQVVVKCRECGKEYVLNKEDKLSEFKCKCGGDLEYKDYSEKSPKSKKKYKTVSLVVISLIVVVFVAFILFSGIYPIDQKSNVTANNTTTPQIATSTYAANGITFQYPSEMIQINNLNSPSRWGITDPVVAFYEPEGDKTENDDLNTYFYIKQRSVTSLDDQISSYRIDIAEIGQTEVSSRNITVNGMNAIELIKTWHAGGKQYKALTVHIEAVPGSVYYRIGCVTPADEFESNLPKFEVIVQSFKIL